MMKLVLIVTVLTPAMTFVTSSGLKNCVDVQVQGDASETVKTFTTKAGELLFIPMNGFKGVTIKMFVDEEIKTKRISRDECVKSFDWNKLKVHIKGTLSSHKCTYEINNCHGECGSIRDLAFDNFQEFNVAAHGASLWSLNITQKTQCNTPTVSTTTSADPTAAAPAKPTTTPVHPTTAAKGSPVWAVAVGGGVVVVLVVVAVAWIIAREMQCFRKWKMMQHTNDIYLSVCVPTLCLSLSVSLSLSIYLSISIKSFL